MAHETARLYRLNPDISMVTNIPRTTLYEHRKRGWLRTISVGSRTYVTDEALNEYLARLEAESNAGSSEDESTIRDEHTLTRAAQGRVVEIPQRALAKDRRPQVRATDRVKAKR
jgi:hypothetical protein